MEQDFTKPKTDKEQEGSPPGSHGSGVEDKLVEAAIKRAFKKLNLKNPLIVAKNGSEAIDQLRDNNGAKITRPYLIILDLNMPVMNGFEFLHFIRNDKDLLDLVVFVLTTSSDLNDKLEAYQQNIAGYMVKGNFARKNYQGLLEMLSKYWKVMELPA